MRPNQVMKRYRANERGFSLVEVLLALTVVLVATAPLLHVAAAAQRLAQSQSEATDVSQRIRVAAERLRADLSAAGSGVISGPLNADFGAFVASIVPARLGSRSPDPPMSAADDRLTILYVPESAWPSALVLPMVTAAAPLAIDATAPECPAAGTCGFAAGTRALLFDASEPGAGHELFTVTETSGGLAHDSPNLPFERVYAAPDSYVLPIVQRTYYFDRPNSRLMVYDGYQTDSPLIDNVLDLRFSYFVDGRAASVMLPAEGRGNCLYDAGSPPVPRLDERGSGLVELTLPGGAVSTRDQSATTERSRSASSRAASAPNSACCRWRYRALINVSVVVSATSAAAIAPTRERKSSTRRTAAPLSLSWLSTNITNLASSPISLHSTRALWARYRRNVTGIRPRGDTSNVTS